MAKIKVKLKRNVQRGRKSKRWNLEGIEEKAQDFQKEILRDLAGCKDNRGNSVDKDWKEFRDAVKKSAEVTIGCQKKKKAKKPWVTGKMFDKKEERRKYKKLNTEVGKKKYRQLNNELRRKTDKARDDWWREECDELEELDKIGRTDLMYPKVK